MKKNDLRGPQPASAGEILRFVLIVVLRYALVALIAVVGISWVAHTKPKISEHRVAALVDAPGSAPHSQDKVL